MDLASGHWFDGRHGSNMDLGSLVWTVSGDRWIKVRKWFSFGYFPLTHHLRGDLDHGEIYEASEYMCLLVGDPYKWLPLVAL